MHSVWIGVDSGVPVKQQTGHHVACVAHEWTLLWIRTTPSGMHRVWIGVDSGVPVQKLIRYHASTLR